jgi:DNA-binding response OmpR family regulator
MRILIIDDDELLAEQVKTVLTQKNYFVDIANEGNIGLEMALSDRYDVAIVDSYLPGRDGLSVCRAVRNARLPLALLLVGHSTIHSRIMAFDNSADDFISKPFDLDELQAHIRALGRRYLSPSRVRVAIEL